MTFPLVGYDLEMHVPQQTQVNVKIMKYFRLLNSKRLNIEVRLSAVNAKNHQEI